MANMLVRTIASSSTRGQRASSHILKGINAEGEAGAVTPCRSTQICMLPQHKSIDAFIPVTFSNAADDWWMNDFVVSANRKKWQTYLFSTAVKAMANNYLSIYALPCVFSRSGHNFKFPVSHFKLPRQDKYSLQSILGLLLGLFPLPSWAKTSKGRCPRGILVKCPNHLRGAAVLLQARPRWPSSSPDVWGWAKPPCWGKSFPMRATDAQANSY